MEQIKSAITQLEQAVLKLETAVHTCKRERSNSSDKIAELKGAIRRTYDRLEKALETYKKGEG